MYEDILQGLNPAQREAVVNQDGPSLIIAGAGIAIAMEIIGGSVLPFAVGMYLPIHLSAPIMCGGLVKLLVEKKKAKAEEREAQLENGILFSSGNASLTAAAKNSLGSFKANVLTSDMDLAIVGYTDNDPWKGCTAEQSKQKNLVLSEQRAQSVSSYLLTAGARSSQIKYVVGKGEENPVASNATAAGKAENRRVEVYMYASPEMIQQAEAGTLR